MFVVVAAADAIVGVFFLNSQINMNIYMLYGTDNVGEEAIFILFFFPFHKQTHHKYNNKNQFSGMRVKLYYI